MMIVALDVVLLTGLAALIVTAFWAVVTGALAMVGRSPAPGGQTHEQER